LSSIARRGRRFAVPNREHEVRAHEQVQLAELDLLGVVPVVSRTQHYEQGVAVALQLRTLAGRDSVSASVAGHATGRPARYTTLLMTLLVSDGGD
jgi:hypothetical protein